MLLSWEYFLCAASGTDSAACCSIIAWRYYLWKLQLRNGYIVRLKGFKDPATIPICDSLSSKEIEAIGFSKRYGNCCRNIRAQLVNNYMIFFLSSICQLLVEANGSTRTLILNRPKQLNALSPAMVCEEFPSLDNGIETFQTPHQVICFTYFLYFNGCTCSNSTHFVQLGQNS
jgi:hypothetical protein